MSSAVSLLEEKEEAEGRDTTMGKMEGCCAYRGAEARVPMSVRDSAIICFDEMRCMFSLER